MDWPKIKSMLIVLLVVTNIILVFFVWQDSVTFDDYQGIQYEDVITFLGENNVKVDFGEADFPKSITQVQLEFIPFDDSLVHDFLGDHFVYDGQYYVSKAYVAKKNDNSFIWAHENHLTRVEQDHQQNLVHFEAISDANRMALITEKVNDFIKDIESFETYRISEIVSLAEYTVVHLKQYHLDYVIEESKATLWLYNDDLVGLKWNWPAKILETSLEKYDIISIDRALLYGMSMFESGDVIKHVSLVFKLNDPSLSIEDLISGVAMPYFKCVLQDGKTYYIQAVNNN